MYHNDRMPPYLHYMNTSKRYNPYRAYPYPCPYWDNAHMYPSNYSPQLPPPCFPITDKMEYDSRFDDLRFDDLRFDDFQSVNDDSFIELQDYGPDPFVVNIEDATKQNNYYRTALWTGSYLQITLMSINVGEDIGLELHPSNDQFIRIEQGQGLVQMGDREDRLDFQRQVYDDYAFIIPAGKWHNLINTGNKPLKLYSIYAPPQHPHGTVHETKAVAEAAEEHYYD